jgi:hypothetical protein
MSFFMAVHPSLFPTKTYIMTHKRITGYYLGTDLYIVFKLQTGNYAHCSRTGYFVSDKFYPEAYEEYFR